MNEAEEQLRYHSTLITTQNYIRFLVYVKFGNELLVSYDLTKALNDDTLLFHPITNNS